ncbi:MAG: phosphopyruvate hydratase [Candidatus Hodarchaeales archaeon]|jgi:enolase
MGIKKIKSREVFDSRGNPTIEVDIYSDKNNLFARSMVPSGASTGAHEALELRDGDKTRLLGKGVLKAVKNVNEIIAPKLFGYDPSEQTDIDNLMFELDGTEAKSKLGANAILSVSIATCKLAALEKEMQLFQYIASLAKIEDFVLPVPSLNVINGGSHAGNKLDIQEFMILPVGASTFKEAMVMGAEVYQNLKILIKKKYGRDAINVGDEGGFAPPFEKTDESIKILLEAVDVAGHTGKIKLGFDAAASEYYLKDESKYSYEGKKISSDELLERYLSIISDNPVISFEDPFDEEDFESFKKMTSKTGNNVQIVGDDLLVTNVKRIQKAIDMKACNALLLKVNQIGSITESIQASKLSKSNNWGVMMSHRSGETEDSFIADLVVGLKSGQIKTGAPARSERLAKYNQLIRIEEYLEENNINHQFAGNSFRSP